MSRVVVITTSLRAKSNSDRLSEELIRGAKSFGHETELISLKNKRIDFCRGCLACQKTQRCVIGDDAVRIAEKVKNADTIVFATPIYYYEMSGRMKTLLDRLNPLYPSDYSFRKVYMMCVAAEEEASVPEKAVLGLQGWVDCFEKAELADTIFFGGINEAGEAERHQDKLEAAYEFGRKLR